MEKNYLSCDFEGNKAIILTGEENELVVANEVIENINQYTNSQEETISLLSYLKDRFESNSEFYNAKFSDMLIEKLFVSLLSLGFSPDQIEIALESLNYEDLFGKVDESFKLDTDNDDINARVAYVCYRVKEELQFTPKADEENESGSGRTGR